MSVYISGAILVAIYLLVGLAPAYCVKLDSSENLLTSLLNLGLLGKYSTYIFVFMVLVPSIGPCFTSSVNNMVQNNICGKGFVVPWIVTIPLQSGEQMKVFVSWTSMLFTSFVNFTLVAKSYMECRRFRIKYMNDRILSKKQKKLLKFIHHLSHTVKNYIDNCPEHSGDTHGRLVYPQSRETMCREGILTPHMVRDTITEIDNIKKKSSLEGASRDKNKREQCVTQMYPAISSGIQNSGYNNISEQALELDEFEQKFESNINLKSLSRVVSYEKNYREGVSFRHTHKSYSEGAICNERLHRTIHRAPSRLGNIRHRSLSCSDVNTNLKMDNFNNLLSKFGDTDLKRITGNAHNIELVSGHSGHDSKIHEIVQYNRKKHILLHIDTNIKHKIPNTDVVCHNFLPTTKRYHNHDPTSNFLRSNLEKIEPKVNLLSKNHYLNRTNPQLDVLADIQSLEHAETSSSVNNTDITTKNYNKSPRATSVTNNFVTFREGVSVMSILSEHSNYSYNRSVNKTLCDELDNNSVQTLGTHKQDEIISVKSTELAIAQDILDPPECPLITGLNKDDREYTFVEDTQLVTNVPNTNQEVNRVALPPALESRPAFRFLSPDDGPLSCMSYYSRRSTLPSDPSYTTPEFKAIPSWINIDEEFLAKIILVVTNGITILGICAEIFKDD